MNTLRSILAFAIASAALLPVPVTMAASGDIVVTGSTQQGGRLATISLSFPASQQASALWLAWGAADGGDAIGNWDDLEYLGDVPEGDTTWTGPVGTYHAGKTYARIFRIAADTSLVELESVSAANGSYVLTDFTPTGTTFVRCDVRFDNVSSAFALFGARQASGNTQFVMIHTTDQGFRHDYHNGIFNSRVKATAGTRYRVEMDYTSLKTNGQFVVNLNSAGPDNFTTPCPMAVFAMNTAGDIGSSATATIYSFMAWSDRTRTTPALDLVPCAHNGVAGFYDRAHGAFLAPSGGTLAAGAAKAHSTCGTSVGNSATLIPYGTDRTVSVASFSREGRQPKADLTFTPGLADCGLVAVHGPTDAGDNIADWPNAFFLGTVPASTTSVTATIPWTIPDETPHFFRFFLVSPIDPATGDSLRLFEGLHANGGPYVLTGFTATGDTIIQAGFSMDDISNTQILFSGRDANRGKSFTLMYVTDGNGFRFDYDSSIMNSHMTSNDGIQHWLEGDYTGLKLGSSTSDLDYINFLNGTPHHAALNLYNNFTAGQPLTVFALNTAGTITTPARAVCYGLKAWSDRARTMLALDLVPCDRNGEAGLWDKVGCRFYGNAGSGALEAIGAEVMNANATVVSRSATLPLPSPVAFVMVIR